MINKLKNLEGVFSINKAALIVGLLTLFGKFIALVRENIFATVFGQDKILDTYYAAFRIPDFITNLFILSTLSVAFLPVFSGILSTNKQEANKFANNVLNLLLLTIGALSLLLFLFAGPLVKKLVPGFSPEQYLYTLKLTKLILLSPIIHSLSTFFGGILNANKKFFITSLAPIFYNFGIIFGILCLYPKYGIMGLGYGAILGAVIQACLQIFASLKLGFCWQPILKFREKSLDKLFKVYAPRIFAFDLSNITLILGTMIGSQLASGSIASLNQAFNLQSVPVGVFAYALSIASFPVLSEFFALKDEKNFIKIFSQTLRQLLFLMIPISVLMLLLRAYIVRLILGRGNFTWEDTIMTFTILGIFSFSLLSQSLTTFLSRAFFARLNTKTPVLINIVCIIINIVLTYLLGQKYGIQGITWSFVIASITNALLLFIVLRKELNALNHTELKIFDKELFFTSTKIIFSTLIMGCAVYGTIYLIEPLVNTRTIPGLIIQAGEATIIGVIIYLMVASKLGLKQADSVVNLLNINKPRSQNEQI